MFVVDSTIMLMLELELAVGGIHRQGKVGSLFGLDAWNGLKRVRLIRQRPSGYCYTTWFGNEVLKRNQQLAPYEYR